jgi:3-methylcrotonyl-CoA carboxylase alpha subunit
MEGHVKTVAIANRGEVAIRIIRACQEMGIQTVLLHSQADVQTRAYRIADRAVCIGGSPSAESYLNIPAVIQGAIAGHAQGIHPGFGFLSENADFAEECARAGLTFIGPSPQAIRTLGDKVNCKELAKALGLPLIPGYQGEKQDLDTLVQEVRKIGLPVMVKAAAGGGGRGMKMIRDMKEAKELLESAQRESQAAFGSPKVFLEKMLENAKHIEFQVFGDASGKVIHLNDRECSVQRRHQKIIEEALSPSLTPELRARMGQAACKLIAAGKYRGAGTVEFLLQDGAFYLLEVNTRLQVEHPVTEEVMGVDLVKAQLLTALNQPAFFNSESFAPRGHSIECRIYAENPYLGGVPSTGKLGTVEWPEGAHRRFEFGFEAGDTVTSFYDSMIAKVIVWDETRIRAIHKMDRVLSESVIFGVHTNIPFLRRMIMDPDFIENRITTRWVDQKFTESLPAPTVDERLKKIFSESIKRCSVGSPDGAGVSADTAGPFQTYWRSI